MSHPTRPIPGRPPRAALASRLLLAGAAAAVLMLPGPVPALAMRDQMNVQGVLRDASGQALTGSFDVTLTLCNAATGGSEILVDAHLASGTGAVSVTGGLLNMALGGGALSDGSGPGTFSTLAEVFAAHDNLWLQIQVGTDPPMVPRIPVLSGGFALNADRLDGKESAEFLGTSADPQTRDGDLRLRGRLTVSGPLIVDAVPPVVGEVLTATDITGTADWRPPLPGPEGPPGPQGPPGSTGPTGPQGPAGLLERLPGSYSRPDHFTNVGQYTSLMIGTNGFPVISYLDQGNGDLRVMTCRDSACISVGALTLAGSGVDRQTSITMGPDGLPRISFFRQGGIWYARCSTAECTSSVLTQLSGEGGEYSSIAIGADGLPIISYASTSGEPLRSVKCLDTDCTSTVIHELDIEDSSDPSIAIANDGFPIIAYRRINSTFATGDLAAIKCHDHECTPSLNDTLVLEPGANDVGVDASITIGDDGLPLIVHHDVTDGALRVFHCGDDTCLGPGSSSSLVESSNVSPHSSVTIGQDGLPVIAYYKSIPALLKFVRCLTHDCSSITRPVVVDDTPDVGQFVSMAIGMDGMPVISYYDDQTQVLAVAKCGNVFCVPYWTRR